jgi:hypothetical protein
MPSPESILESLAATANSAVTLAVMWHVLLLAVIVALLAGWRPSQRFAAASLAAPLASVSALAFRHGNPFNGVVFALLALALLALALRLNPRPVRRGGLATTVMGAFMIAFAWVYPHFLGQHPPAMYLIAAPMGLIPCPTLALVMGLTLLAGGFGSKMWSLMLAGAGLFYSLFGVARLGVTIDVALAAGALALVVLAASSRAAAAQVSPSAAI